MCNCNVQTISGTGGVRLAGEFFSKFLGKGTPIYMPNPTWGNHIPIMKVWISAIIFMGNMIMQCGLNDGASGSLTQDAGLEVRKYAYYEPASRGLDFSGLISDLKGAPESSLFLLHACAHNPTGVDPTFEQWQEISEVMKAKNHIAFFDCAYQGFASGDPTRDAAAIRYVRYALACTHIATLDRSLTSYFLSFE